MGRLQSSQFDLVPSLVRRRILLHQYLLTQPFRNRAYLALFEQTLSKHVKDIAAEYKSGDKQKYVDAAQNFRLPCVSFHPPLQSCI
jgi:hypothetical protein